MRRKVAILGSTGSIGTNAMKVAQNIPHLIEITGLAALNNYKLLAKQATKHNVKHICIYNSQHYESLKKLVSSDVVIYTGEEGLLKIAEILETDILLVAIVGTKGLHPTLKAISLKKDIALASKEIMVMAGEIVMNEVKKNNVKILPVDSEHNAIFQCLQCSENKKEISRLILTASGGPFRKFTKDEINNVTLEQALNHPTWSMGKKITIDSATLFNKGLEMIEAHFLFDIDIEKIDIIIHPQSIIHSMVEYIDGSTLAQMSVTSMEFPIQYALTYPNRVKSSIKFLDWKVLNNLEFYPPREDIFESISLARYACKNKGTYSTVLNAANEIAVEHFLSQNIKFTDITDIVKNILNNHKNIKNPSLEDILEVDKNTRLTTENFITEKLY